MNRAERRKQAQIAKHKPNRSAIKYNTDIQLEFESFDSIDRMFQQIRHGALSYEQGEGFVIMGLSGEMLHIESALAGWIEYWKELTEHVGAEYDDAALVRLLKALEYAKPLSMREVDAAYKVVDVQRALYRALPKQVTTEVALKVKNDIRVTDEIRQLIRA